MTQYRVGDRVAVYENIPDATVNEVIGTISEWDGEYWVVRLDEPCAGLMFLRSRPEEMGKIDDREYELILKALDDEDALEGRRRDNRATARRIAEKIRQEDNNK